MKIGICSDHAGFELKQLVIAHLEGKGMQVKDFGTYSADSCDYPDYAHPCAEALENSEVDLAVAMCGSGNGIAMTLNKHQGVRAAICWNRELAELARQHNNANCIVLPARFIPAELGLELVDAFLSTPFEGGRHERRVAKIACR